MQRMSWILPLAAVMVAAALFAAQEPEGGLKVSRMVFCRQIVDREPQGVQTALPDTVGRVYCFTHIEGAQGEIEIRHRWYHGDSLMAEVTLPVRSASWRTWSSKNMWKGWRGEWRVEVVGPDDTVLRQESFTLEKTE